MEFCASFKQQILKTTIKKGTENIAEEKFPELAVTCAFDCCWTDYAKLFLYQERND